MTNALASAYVVAFVTDRPATNYECAEASGSLKDTNGSLIAKYCTVCEALQRNRCLRATSPAVQAAKVFTWITETAKQLEQARHFARRLRKVYRKCGWCSRLAIPGYKTCEKHHSRKPHKRAEKHECATRGCKEETVGKHCKSCAARLREARLRKERRDGLQ